ncbi:VRR-NUC domain-containing protein [Halomonas sp. 3H]|uniref:VRR-NUC domain-containing protein n=1 Tax=Halomonas sp. 3H TaxID=2952527 RepID=UPI0020B8E4E0|nr:VRR-NUC domain-containing protein [Halomonas sp. 3H]
MTSISPAASLADPFYYLVNFQFVLDWVAERHGDLLGDEEQAFLVDFAALPRASRALLVRMVMRRGEHFRTSKLVYPEINTEIDAEISGQSGGGEAALAPLVAAGLVEDDPALSLVTLFAQLRLPELRLALADEIRAAGLPASLGKAALLDVLAPRGLAARPLAAWWPAAPDRVVRLTVMATCDRLRLMFFGNLRQDWSDFVLAELGVQRFERVAFSADSRAFQRRAEVDAYLALHRLRERLDADEPVATLAAERPAVPADNAWLAARRRRLDLALGRQAERAGEGELALGLYHQAGWPVDAGSVEARIRYLRLLERRGEHAEAHALSEARVEALAGGAPGEAEAQALSRLLPRLRRRLGLAAQTREAAPAPERLELCLPASQSFSLGVERAVGAYLQHDDAPVAYVENTLLTGLFGLLCWEALFAPLPGAFFHPFHSGPADLYREDFVARRRERFDACLARLDDGRHERAILSTWREKQGLANPFVHWGALDEALLSLSLSCLPAEHLRACFARLLGDLKANRAGLPDLIQFFPQAAEGEPRYRLIEVKGPGDRLQDNQRRWLAFFHEQGIPAAVCHVRWVQLA